MFIESKDLSKEFHILYARFANNDLNEAETNRLNNLAEILNQLNYKDRNVTLIPASSWQDYCENLAYDIGYIQRDCSIVNCVDWEQWASN